MQQPILHTHSFSGHKHQSPSDSSTSPPERSSTSFNLPLAATQILALAACTTAPKGWQNCGAPDAEKDKAQCTYEAKPLFSPR